MRLRVFISLLAALFALVSSGGVAAAGSPASGPAVRNPVRPNNPIPLNNSRPAPGLHTDNHQPIRPQSVRHVRTWDCPPGSSCHQDGLDGTGGRRVVPHRGAFDPAFDLAFDPAFDLGRMGPPSFTDGITSL